MNLTKYIFKRKDYSESSFSANNFVNIVIKNMQYPASLPSF